MRICLDKLHLLTNKGITLSALGQIQDALNCYEQALKIAPHSPAILGNIANSLTKLNRAPEALEYFAEAAKLNPSNHKTLCNMSIAYRDLGQIQQSIECCQKAIALCPDYAEGHLTLGINHLLLGDFEQGWSNYQWRWHLPSYSFVNNFHKPWKGDLEDLKNKSLLILSEQGLGDAIQFIRYASWIKSQQPTTTLLVSARSQLHQLLQNTGLFTQIFHSKKPIPTDQYDRYVLLMDLPYIFWEDLDSIPRPISIKTTTPSSSIKDILNRYKNKFRIGISWSGSPTNHSNLKRSCSLKRFSSLAAMKDVQLFSLQKNQDCQQLTEVNFPIVDLGGHSRDLADTAGIIQEMDLIITVDSSLAHLAASLDQKTWVLLSYVSDWRWLISREDSPWYPSIRLFRQCSYNNWSELFERLQHTLARLL